MTIAALRRPWPESGNAGGKTDASEDEHADGRYAGDPGQGDNFEQATATSDGNGGDGPQRQGCADPDGQRVVIPSGEARSGDLSQVTELGDQDHSKAGPGNPPEPRLPVQLGVLIAAFLTPAAQQENRAEREQ